MDEEISALILRGHGSLWRYLITSMLLLIDGYLPSNFGLIGPLNGIKLVWLQRASLRRMGMKLFAWSNLLVMLLKGRRNIWCANDIVGIKRPRHTYESTSSLKIWGGQGITWELKSLIVIMDSLYLKEYMLVVSFKKQAYLALNQWNSYGF
ncbi:UNVERIFIED_CONTAM: hypothetical protein Slati_0498000 [Sesamum latifolium]|uniref:Uncharacterized protein n=1 Tax=Sesamum latifolium TaxID=2727402 RepID=A0AAW2XYP0_9LAMI